MGYVQSAANATNQGLLVLPVMQQAETVSARALHGAQTQDVVVNGCPERVGVAQTAR